MNSGNSICKTIEVIETGKSRPGQSGTSIWLAQDNGTSWYGPETLGTATTLSNSQCEIDVENSSVAGDGTLLNLTVTYEFLTDFGGSAGVWGNVEDGSTGSPWPWIGGWTPNQAPTADSVSPASGSGSDPEFTFEFSDADGHGTLHNTLMLVNSTLTGAKGCYLYQEDDQLWLAQNDGTNWYGPVTMGSTSTLQNSQCKLYAANSWQLGSGADFTVHVRLEFFGAFSGSRTVWGYADDGTLNSGWQTLGSWTVP